MIVSAGPQERFFYDKWDEETKKQNLSQMSENERNYQQAAYELYVTEQDHIRDMEIVVKVNLSEKKKNKKKKTHAQKHKNTKTQKHKNTKTKTNSPF